MFNNLGIEWAGTLLGCLAAVMVPIPVLFIVYGRKLREKSKFSPTFSKPEPKHDEEESGTDVDEATAAQPTTTNGTTATGVLASEKKVA